MIKENDPLTHFMEEKKKNKGKYTVTYVSNVLLVIPQTKVKKKKKKRGLGIEIKGSQLRLRGLRDSKNKVMNQGSLC